MTASIQTVSAAPPAITSRKSNWGFTARTTRGRPNSNIRGITRQEGPKRGLASLMRPLRPLPASCSWEEAATRRPEHQPQRSLRQSASVVSSPPHYSTLRDVGYRHLSRGQQTKGRAADASCQVSAAVWHSPGCRGSNKGAVPTRLGAAVVRLRAPNHPLSLEMAQKFSSWPCPPDEKQGYHQGADCPEQYYPHRPCFRVVLAGRAVLVGPFCCGPDS